MAAASEALKKLFRVNRVDDTNLSESFGYICDVCRNRIKVSHVDPTCSLVHYCIDGRVSMITVGCYIAILVDRFVFLTLYVS